MKNYSKPEFEFIQLTSEEKFAVGSACLVVGACSENGKLIMDGPI